MFRQTRVKSTLLFFTLVSSISLAHALVFECPEAKDFKKSRSGYSAKNNGVTFSVSTKPEGNASRIDLVSNKQSNLAFLKCYYLLPDSNIGPSIPDNLKMLLDLKCRVTGGTYASKRSGETVSYKCAHPGSCKVVCTQSKHRR